MSSLRITIGGVRGIVGESLTPDLIVRYSQALGTYVEGGKVLVSRDTRKSGEMVASCVLAGLIGTGCEVVDLGICPTAALQLAVRGSDASGGLAVTAGHNPEGWNALKSVRSDGMFLNPAQASELLDIYHQGEFTKATWDRLHPVAVDSQAKRRHIDAICSQLDCDAIARTRLRVAIDCANGATSRSAPVLLELLGLDVVALNTEIGAPFPHPPEPSAHNLAQLRALTAAAGADVGFAFDADGDRLGVVCGDGSTPGEEATVCLATEAVLRRGDEGPVVTNLCTTRALDDVAARYGREIIHTAIGQAYIAEAAANHGAAVAGEGSGGVVFPRINYAHDSLAAMGYILQLMADSGHSLGELTEQLPVYSMAKMQIACPVASSYTALERLRARGMPEWATAEDLQDGVKYSNQDQWVHVRVSATEPIIRVIAEARAPDAADALARHYLNEVRQLM